MVEAVAKAVLEVVFEVVLEARERASGYAEDVLGLIEGDRLRPRVERGCFLAPLVAACCDKDPEQRPSFEAVVQQLSEPALAAAAWPEAAGLPRATMAPEPQGRYTGEQVWCTDVKLPKHYPEGLLHQRRRWT